MDTEMKGKLRNDFFEKHPIYKQFLDGIHDAKFCVILMPRRHGRTMFSKRVLREPQKCQSKNNDTLDALTYAALYLGIPPQNNAEKPKPHNTCPKCGGKITLHHPYTHVGVCHICGTTVNEP